MFHTSSFRHEQYVRSTLSNSSKATLHKKRSSLESEGADSGYNSSSSIPTSTKDDEQQKQQKLEPQKSTTSNDTYYYISQQQKRVQRNKSERSNTSSKYQPPRQPDLVYSCPRPIAFPFHNDDHFLPIAEADPRDVARVSPSSLNRSSSINSSTHLLKKDTDSSYSRHSSILSTIQRGTVRSLRSMFQLPDSSKVSNTTTINNSSRVQTTASLNNQRLEIKTGTVQSIKNMFASLKPASTQTRPVSITNKGVVNNKVNQFESSQVMGLKVNVTPSTNNKRSSFFSLSSAKELKSKLFSKRSSSTLPPPLPPKNNVPASPPKETTSIRAKVKKISDKVINTLKPAPKAPTVPTDNTPKPKKSLFSAFKSNKSSDDKKKPTEPTNDVEQDLQKETRVKKIWKGFKNLVTGKKSSRIGIM